jgi:hypothetical protein
MRKALPFAAFVFPLLVTAAVFRFAPRSEQLGPMILSSALLGWIGLACSEIRRLWLKVVLVLGYPPVMWVGIMAVMVVVYGYRGFRLGGI